MWPKKAIDWIENGTALVSIPFTWELPQAYSRCVFLREQGYKVRAGGPAVSLMPDYLVDVAEIGGEVDALKHHNPNATFTSRGCIRKCGFCAVPKIEGDLVELDDWEPKPIVCDNNLLACSKAHFDGVIDALKPFREVDFNQGLDARLLSDYHAERLAELDCLLIRLAWDHIKVEGQTLAAIDKICKAGFPPNKIRVYVLIGHKDHPDDALYRLETLKSLGVLPCLMRFQPLDALEKNSYVSPNWSEQEFKKFAAYWGRQVWYGHLSFDEFDIVKRSKKRRAQLLETHEDQLGIF